MQRGGRDEVEVEVEVEVKVCGKKKLPSFSTFV